MGNVMYPEGTLTPKKGLCNFTKLIHFREKSWNLLINGKFESRGSGSGDQGGNHL